jgi:hypothetical protein
VPLSPALLSDARLPGRGHGAVRQAVLQRLQQTAGNRSARRHVQRALAARAPGGAPGPAVQRKVSVAGEVVSSMADVSGKAHVWAVYAKLDGPQKEKFKALLGVEETHDISEITGAPVVVPAIEPPKPVVVSAPAKAASSPSVAVSAPKPAPAPPGPRPSDLDTVDRDSNALGWARVLAKLLAAGVVTLGQNPADDLNGDGRTIEVRCFVKKASNGKALGGSSFVIHYHPYATKAGVKAGVHNSQMHLKAYKGAKSHVNLESIPAEILALVPRFREIKLTYRAKK